MGLLIDGLADANGRCVESGQRVRFRYRRHTGDEGGGYDVETFEAEGEIRMSPFMGAYIVGPHGNVHNVHRKTWFEVIDTE